MQEHAWPVDLGVGIGLQAQLEQSDTEGLFEGSLPEPSAAEDDVATFEAGFGEQLPRPFRNFLLHANGWHDFYFGLNLFGLAELRGGGKAQRAAELIASYEAEEVFEESGINVADLLPVAAGDGIDLVVLIREGRTHAGAVFWFDGGEYARFEDFGEFFEFVLQLLQRYLARHQPEGDIGPASEE